MISPSRKNPLITALNPRVPIDRFSARPVRLRWWRVAVRCLASGAIGVVASVATAQTDEPQRFNPPVHISPAAEHNVLRTSGTEDLYGDDTNGLRWKTADSSQRRGTTRAQTDNAVFSRNIENGDEEVLKGQLITDGPDEPNLAAPIDDPYNDRKLNLRTEHDSDTAPSNSPRRSSRGKRRAFAAGLQTQDDLRDPYQGKGEPNKDQDPKSNEPAEKTCDEYRQQLLNQPITQVDINISAPRPADKQVVKSSQSRSWTDRYGNILATGVLADLRNGYAMIDSGTGQVPLAVARLSDEDLGAISQSWRIPTECTLGDNGSAERCWTPQTYTWKASNLCHKPLYFEDEQLERYGHSAGPVLQPLKSTAHFFIRAVTLPYQMGIHPANECQYALGFYRPGNCAPWLCDPIPISLSGARHQATVTTAAAFILP